jgi:hypothetical protein
MQFALEEGSGYPLPAKEPLEVLPLPAVDP